LMMAGGSFLASLAKFFFSFFNSFILF
jgi:hypothetical protein